MCEVDNSKRQDDVRRQFGSFSDKSPSKSSIAVTTTFTLFDVNASWLALTLLALTSQPMESYSSYNAENVGMMRQRGEKEEEETGGGVREERSREGRW